MLENWYYIPLIILAGFIAGSINTVAGSGSVISLAMLSFLGLPSSIANGTNRIGVLFQSLIGYLTYKKHSPIEVSHRWDVILLTVIGALCGSFLAVQINEQLLNLSIAGLMMLLLVLVLMESKKWIKKQSESEARWSKPIQYIAFFFIGVYGGYIQAGVGIFLLSALILGMGLNLQSANGLKLVIVGVYTIPTLLYFLWNGQVNWTYGLLLAVGQIMGAWVAARFATQYPNANVWIRYLLIGILIISIIRFLYKAFV